MLRLTFLACLFALALPVSAQQALESGHGTVADDQKSDVDAIVDVAIRMASDSQAYYLKPHNFGGGEGSFDGVSLTALQYGTNEIGQHVRRAEEGAGTHTFTLDEDDGVVTIEGVSDRHDKVVRVTVSGPTLEDFALTVSRP